MKKYPHLIRKLQGNKLIPVVLAILVVVGCWYFAKVVFQSVQRSQMPVIKCLPETATLIGTWDGSTWSDVFFIMKAKMSQKDFDVYIQNLGYLPLTEDSKEDVIWVQNYGGLEEYNKAPSWWDVSLDNEETFLSPHSNVNSGAYQIIKYENGYVYYLDIDF